MNQSLCQLQLTNYMHALLVTYSRKSSDTLGHSSACCSWLLPDGDSELEHNWQCSPSVQRHASCDSHWGIVIGTQVSSSLHSLESTANYQLIILYLLSYLCSAIVDSLGRFLYISDAIITECLGSSETNSTAGVLAMLARSSTHYTTQLAGRLAGRTVYVMVHCTL